MANEKITELIPFLTSPVDADVLVIVDKSDTSVSITGQTKGITVDDLILTSTQTLTNKTLTSPAINTPVVSGGTVDNAVIGGTTAAAGTFTQVDIESQGDLRLQDSTGGEYVALQAPTAATSYTLTMPTAVGSSGQVLETSDGSGTLAWVTRDVGDITGVTAGTNISITDPTGPVPTINVDDPLVADVTGNADTATALETARTIGGTSFDGTGNIVPATITVADTTDTSCSVGLFESATGDLAPKSDGGITYNAGTGMLTATGLTGPLTGNADTVTTNANLTGEVTSSGNAATITDDTVDEANLKVDNSPTNDYVLTAKSSASGGLTWTSPTTGDITGVTAGTNLNGGGASGDVTLNLDTTITGLTSVTSTTFVGALTGNADTATTAATVTGAAQTAITSVGTLTALTVGSASGITVEANGDIAFNNDSGNPKVFWDASTGFLGVGQATASTYNLEVSGTIYGGNGAGSGTAATFQATGNNGTGVLGRATDGTGTIYGVYGSATGTSSTNNYGGYFTATGATNNYGLVVAAGNVGINVDDPDSELEINGQIKITDSTKGAGKVLTSDADGLATWVTPAAGGAAIDTAVTGATEGSVLFAGADAGSGGVLAQDNSNLFWDDTNKRLGIGGSPTSVFTVTGDPASGQDLAYIYHSGTGASDHGLSVQIASSLSAARGLRVSTGGSSNALCVMGDGSVGVGTAAPTSIFTVTGAPTSGDYLTYLYHSGTLAGSHGLNVQIASALSGAYGLRVNTGGNSNALAVMGSGDVGIGRLPVENALEVEGSGYFTGQIFGAVTALSEIADVEIDFDGTNLQTIEVTGTCNELSTTNLAAGKTVEIRIYSNNSDGYSEFVPTTPSWKEIATSISTVGVNYGEYGILKLTSWSDDDVNVTAELQTTAMS